MIFLLSSFFRSGDSQSETKQFQELLLERTKVLAAQAEALKSNSDGKNYTKCIPNVHFNFLYLQRNFKKDQFDAIMYSNYIRPFLPFFNCCLSLF